MKVFLSALAAVLCMAVSGFCRPAAALPGDAKWDGSFGPPPGLNGDAYCSLAVGLDLYVGGSFSKAGDQDVSNLARWDGNRWHAVGGGLKGTVYALAARGRDLFVAGQFTVDGVPGATNIVKWNGKSWISLGQGMPQSHPMSQYPLQRVHALAVDSHNVFIGGSFHQVGGILATNVARWDGRVWHSLGSGVGNGPELFNNSWLVYTLLIYGSDLYVGGEFPNAGEIECKNVARWDGRRWHEVGGGVSGGPPFRIWFDRYTSGWVQAMAFHQGQLYVGGSFTNAGGTSVRSIAWWNGSRWTDLSGGVGLYGDKGYVWSITAAQHGVVVGGLFDHAGNTQSHSIAQYNGSRWSPLGSGISGAVATLAVVRGNLFAGGTFALAGHIAAGFLAEWNQYDWFSVGSAPLSTRGQRQRPTSEPRVNAVIGDVQAIAIGSNSAYLSGHFYSVGAQPGGLLASVQESNLTKIPTPNELGGFRRLAVTDTGLYAAGSFTFPEINATNIAGWNGTEWFPLTSGLTFQGRAEAPYFLNSDGHNLWVSGTFDRAGTQAVDYFAFWNGDEWNGFGTGVLPQDLVQTATGGEKLYFTSGKSIFTWDGSQWGQIDSWFLGTNQVYVVGIAVGRETVYALGSFWDGTNDVRSVASWDGNSWTILANNNGISLLTMCDGTLFVGGSFNFIGDVAANNVAAWDGTRWSALGSGLNGQVNALASDGRNVYFGGYFTTAGQKSSYHFAVWHEN